MVGGQNISSFFPFSAANIVLSSFSGGLYRGIVARFDPWPTQSACLGLLWGHFVGAAATCRPPLFPQDGPREPKRALWVAVASSRCHNSTRRLPICGKNENFAGEKGVKKGKILGEGGSSGGGFQRNVVHLSGNKSNSNTKKAAQQKKHQKQQQEAKAEVEQQK